MSQILPEPTEPTGAPGEPAIIPPESINIPDGPATVTPEPSPGSVDPVVVTPEPSPRFVDSTIVPPGLTATRVPSGPDWRQLSLGWMEKSQEITAKWLYDLGGWIFGGLIVAALMLLQDLISLGFADRATVVAGLAIAIALPFNLAGLGIIRYFNALNQAVEEARQVLAQSANMDAETLIRLTRESDAFPPDKQKIMDSSISLALYLSVLFTLIGLGSALWRISWAATGLFLISSVLCFLLVLRVIRYS